MAKKNEDNKKNQLELSYSTMGLSDLEMLAICYEYQDVGLGWYFNTVCIDFCYNIDEKCWFRYINPNWDEDLGNTAIYHVDTNVVDKLDQLLAIKEQSLNDLQPVLAAAKEQKSAATYEVRSAENQIKRIKTSRNFDPDLDQLRLDQADDTLEAAKKRLEEILPEWGKLVAANKSIKVDCRTMAKKIDGYRTAAGRKNILAVAETSVNTNRVTNKDFDTDPSLLCCQNAVLQFGRANIVQIDASPSLMLRNKLGCDYLPQARNTVWEDALYQICSESKDDTPAKDSMARCLIRLLGCALANLGYKLRHGAIAYGENAQNGKDVVIGEPMLELFGTYGIVHDSALIMEESFNKSAASADPILLSLLGKRLVYMAETDKGRWLSLKKFKQLTGGNRIGARNLHSKDYTQQVITALILLATNDPPLVRGSDKGTEHRMGIYPFTVSFLDNPDPDNYQQQKRDIDLEDKIKSDLPGILNILLEGYLDYMVEQDRSLALPYKVKEATSDFFDDQDELEPWIQARIDRVSADNDAWPRVKLATIFKNYAEWYRDNTGRRPMTSNMFSRLLIRKDFERDKAGGAIYYRGLVLLDKDKDK